MRDFRVIFTFSDGECLTKECRFTSLRQVLSWAFDMIGDLECAYPSVVNFYVVAVIDGCSAQRIVAEIYI